MIILCFHRTSNREFGLSVFGLSGTHLYLVKRRTSMQNSLPSSPCDCLWPKTDHQNPENSAILILNKTDSQRWVTLRRIPEMEAFLAKKDQRPHQSFFNWNDVSMYVHSILGRGRWCPRPWLKDLNPCRLTTPKEFLLIFSIFSNRCLQNRKPWRLISWPCIHSSLQMFHLSKKHLAQRAGHCPFLMSMHFSLQLPRGRKLQTFLFLCGGLRTVLFTEVVTSQRRKRSSSAMSYVQEAPFLNVMTPLFLRVLHDWRVRVGVACFVVNLPKTQNKNKNTSSRFWVPVRVFYLCNTRRFGRKPKIIQLDVLLSMHRSFG